MNGTLLALALITSPAAPGAGTGGLSPPAVYRIEAYLDAAPPGTRPIETVRVGIGDRRRVLQIMSYLRLSEGDPWALVRDVGAFQPDFLLLGPPAHVETLLGGEPGARVRGSFQHIRGSHSLIINPLDLKIEAGEGP
jgi:hypothetical protein